MPHISALHMDETAWIPLTQGKAALVDYDLFNELNRWKWYFTGRYAARQDNLKNGKQRTVFMHRVVLNTPPGLFTDHIDLNKLHNTKANLRVATKSQNGANRKVLPNNKTGLKGACYHKASKSFVAQIHEGGTMRYLGRYQTAQLAHEAYAAAAIKLHGPFARAY